MAKQGGSLGRGRRLRGEVPPVPSPNSLTATQAKAQDRARELVELTGGRFDGRGQVPADHIDDFMDLFNEWARIHGERTSEGIYFNGRPGLWHALDELYPLQDPNRWDALRLAVIERLQASTWSRRRPPRGSAFDIRL